MTGKHPTPESSSKIPKLSEGQLESLFRRLNLANTRRIYKSWRIEPRENTGAIGTSWRFCWRERWRIASKPACSALPARHTFRS